MKCNHCGSEWTTNQSISVSLQTCPFCKTSLSEGSDREQRIFEDSKSALCYIAREFGREELLSRKAVRLFADLAPTLKEEKELIKIIQEKGALEVLRSALQSSVSEQQIAVQRAAAKLPAFMEATAVMSMLYEFAEALGWQLSWPEVSSKGAPEGSSKGPSELPSKGQSTKTQNHPRIQTAPNPQKIQSPAIGSQYPFAGYIWRVLDVQGSQALLLSEKILEKRKYNEKYEATTWAQCTLRTYLNGAFYNSLGQDKARIVRKTIKTSNNPWWPNVSGGKNTEDWIFLLSIEEVVKYFGDSGQLKNKNPRSWSRIDDQYNSARIAYDKDGTASWWWLRSFGNDSYNAANVSRDGNLGVSGNRVHNEGGVRPALWLNL